MLVGRTGAADEHLLCVGGSPGTAVRVASRAPRHLGVEVCAAARAADRCEKRRKHRYVAASSLIDLPLYICIGYSREAVNTSAMQALSRVVKSSNIFGLGVSRQRVAWNVPMTNLPHIGRNMATSNRWSGYKALSWCDAVL